MDTQGHHPVNSAKSALKIALIYAAFGFLWIVFSDKILLFFVKDATLMSSIQTIKGWVYVAASALLIYLLIKARIQRIDDLNRQLRIQERQTQASEKKYRALFENLVDVSYSTDAEGNFTIISPSSLELFGYAPEEVIGKKIANFYRTPERREEFLSLLLKDGFIKNFEAEIRRKDGDFVWVSTNAKVLRDENGNFAGVEGVTRDISNLKRMEQEKIHLEESLRQSQKMEAIGTLAGGIAHDFNNILSAVLGYAELEREKAPKGSDSWSNLETIITAAGRARDLIRQILLFSRKGTKKKTSVQLSLVVDEAVRLLRKTIPSTVDFEVSVDPSSGFVLADPTELHQVVINLCTNALHALPNEEGKIRLTLKPTVVDHLTASKYPNLKEGAYTLLTVEDNGTGMDPLTLSRIFEPFFTTKDQGKGTGMGLAVVHGIVQAGGGAIGVESTLGVGTTFKVFLPQTQKVATAEETTSEVEDLRGEEAILLVDDDNSIAELERRILDTLGYKVRAVTSPLEALEIFKGSPESFDMIITDQTMPEMAGDALAKEAMRVRPGIPVIICTGHSSILDGEKAQAMGVRALLMKPFDLKKLATTVRKIFDELK